MRRLAGDRSRTHCLAWPAGRLGAGQAGGGRGDGRRTAFPQGTPSWQGARSLGGAQQVLVMGSWEQQRGGGSPVAGRAAWQPESGRAGWCGPWAGRRPRRAEGEWGLTDWRDSEESRARERGRARLRAKGAATFVVEPALLGQSEWMGLTIKGCQQRLGDRRGRS